jgi:hypothetical protein
MPKRIEPSCSQSVHASKNQRIHKLTGAAITHPPMMANFIRRDQLFASRHKKIFTFGGTIWCSTVNSIAAEFAFH